MKQRAEITFETEETVVLRNGEVTLAAFCSGCGDVVQMSTPWIASLFSRRSEREIFRLIENGAVHWIETDRVLVCLESLRSASQPQENL